MLEDRFVHDVESIALRGKPVAIRAFDVEKHAAGVPEALTHIWSRFGVASWGGGAFQTCDPDIYFPLCHEVFEGNKIIEGAKVTPFALSAFGFMKAWHVDLGTFEIQYPLARIILPMDPDILRKKAVGNINLIARFPTDEADFPPIRGFKEVFKRHGRLNENEVYEFVPALGLGGSPDPNCTKRLSADVHLSILSGIAPSAAGAIDSSLMRFGFGSRMAPQAPPTPKETSRPTDLREIGDEGLRAALSHLHRNVLAQASK